MNIRVQYSTNKSTTEVNFTIRPNVKLNFLYHPNRFDSWQIYHVHQNEEPLFVPDLTSLSEEEYFQLSTVWDVKNNLELVYHLQKYCYNNMYKFKGSGDFEIEVQY